MEKLIELTDFGKLLKELMNRKVIASYLMGKIEVCSKKI